MEFNPYISFTESRRLGLKFKAKNKTSVLNKNDLRPILYKDMIRRPYIDPLIYDKRKVAIGGNGDNFDTGGIFNLDFSPDSKMLGAACERKCVLVMDPATQKTITKVSNAHNDCVNCIRFLDNRLFATCSDDTTVALWDARYLKKKMRSIKGHSNWVKNIEFSSKDNYLVTSGFDGAVYAWDINKFNDVNEEASKIFYTGGLMRMRLTPTGDKMVISTINGYLILIHDLNLDTLAEDLNGFKPNMYRMLQMSGNPMKLPLAHTPLFHAKRNRVELISDFPNEADLVSSLQVHPQGFVAVSRNITSDHTSEWCCVHDIQSYPVNPDEDEDIVRNPRPRPPAAHRPARQEGQRYSGFMMLAELLQSGNPILQVPRQVRHPDEVINRPIGSVQDAEENPDSPVEEDDFHIRNRERVNEFREILRRISSRLNQRENEAENPEQAQAQASGSSSSLTSSAPAEQESRHALGPDDTTEEEDSDDDPQNHGFLLIPRDPTNGSRPRIFSFRTQRSPLRQRRQRELTSTDAERIPDNARIHHNIKRLTHFVQESNSEPVRLNFYSALFARFHRFFFLSFRAVDSSKKSVSVMMVLSWLRPTIPVCACFPSILKWKICRTDTQLHCKNPPKN